MTTTAPRIRLESIHIENFRGIDQLDLAFPEPVMADEPDVLVLGSANGGGKTSVLEACALAIGDVLCGPQLRGHLQQQTHRGGGIPRHVIRSGAAHAALRSSLLWNRQSVTTRLNLMGRQGRISMASAIDNLGDPELKALRSLYEGLWTEDALQRWVDAWLGHDPEPLILPPLLFFHSYRRIGEGNPSIAGLVGSGDSGRPARPATESVGVFKREALRCLMAKSGLFETGAADWEQVLAVLNRLMTTYARATLEKLRPTEDGSIELRVTPVDKTRLSFAFDSLSSGQKEIISTLFLIWLHTDKQPGIVLLDEPELHLNAEWHTRFLRSLHELCPQNQYIIATHSRTIFESVPPQKRVLLEPSLPGSVEPSV